MSIVAPDLVLVELRDGDGTQNADDGNYNQQLYECET